MLKGKGYLGGFIALVAVVLLAVVVMVTSVQGQAGSQIGTVDMETVFTQYMAAPLFAARDEMQVEYEQKVESLTDDEAAHLFLQYQAELEKLENDYGSLVAAAIQTVADQQGLQVVVDSAAVLHGGLDITDNVLAALK